MYLSTFFSVYYYLTINKNITCFVMLRSLCTKRIRWVDRRGVSSCVQDKQKIEEFVKYGKKIIGAAANYKELLKVLNIPAPSVPGIFIKPTTTYITEGKPIILPKGFSVNEEIELGVIIGKTGKHIKESEALSFIGGYCIALDMTATCQMKEARSKGGSWTIGKGFDTSSPVSKFISQEAIHDPHNVNLWCSVNGKEKQNGNTSDLLFSVPYLISYVSKYMTLEPGDLIITGSPPGMGPVLPGDVVEGGIKDLITIKFTVEEDKQ